MPYALSFKHMADDYQDSQQNGHVMTHRPNCNACRQCRISWFWLITGH